MEKANNKKLVTLVQQPCNEMTHSYYSDNIKNPQELTMHCKWETFAALICPLSWNLKAYFSDKEEPKQLVSITVFMICFS